MTGEHFMGEATVNPRMSRDPDERKRFRYAYALKATRDLSPLAPHVERIKYPIDGYGDHVDNLQDQLEEGLEDFDDQKDVIVPSGSALINLLAGAVIQKKLAEKMKGKPVSFTVAIWSNMQYRFWSVYTDKEHESYELVQ